MSFDFVFPRIIFCIQTSTMNFKGYDLKNVPSTTGRADVIARIIMNALCGPKSLNRDIGIWIFYNKKFLGELHEYFISKGVPCNQPSEFSTLIDINASFFKNNPSQTLLSEQKLLNVLYNSFENINNQNFQKSLFTKVIPLGNTTDIINKMESERKIYVLYEETSLDLLNNQELLSPKQQKFLFFIGDQVGIEKCFEFGLDKYSRVSLGIESQLASNIVLLIKYLLSLP